MGKLLYMVRPANKTHGGKSVAAVSAVQKNVTSLLLQVLDLVSEAIHAGDYHGALNALAHGCIPATFQETIGKAQYDDFVSRLYLLSIYGGAAVSGPASKEMDEAYFDVVSGYSDSGIQRFSPAEASSAVEGLREFIEEAAPLHF